MSAIRRFSVARWRCALTTQDVLVSPSPPNKFYNSSGRQVCLSSPADLQHCSNSFEESGREFVECRTESHHPLRGWSVIFAGRNYHAVVLKIFSVFGRSFDEGGRWPGLGFQCRHLAAKAKKMKSKVENVELTEDVGGTAKGNAVKMMEMALDVLSREHSKLRTGRANSGMLDHISVEAHGVRTPLNHVAAVTVSGLQTLNVLPYDASMVKEVEKAILNSPMGLNPKVDGSTMTIPLPRLTKEHCETMCKVVCKAGESAKLTIRRARKEALDTVKSSGDLSKDDMKRFEKEVEELTKKYTKSIDETCKNKEKEIMA